MDGGYFSHAICSQTLCEVEYVLGGVVKRYKVPHILAQAVTYLNSHMKHVGLFRISVPSAKVRQLQVLISEENGFLDDKLIQSPHEWASLIKHWFTNIEGSILSGHLRDWFFDVIACKRISDENKRNYICILMSFLPAVNLHSLFYFIDFLRRYHEYYDYNKMDAENIAKSCSSILDGKMFQQTCRTFSTSEAEKEQMRVAVKISFLEALIQCPERFLPYSGDSWIDKFRTPPKNTPQKEMKLFPDVELGGKRIMFTSSPMPPRRPVNQTPIRTDPRLTKKQLSGSKTALSNRYHSRQIPQRRAHSAEKILIREQMRGLRRQNSTPRDEISVNDGYDVIDIIAF